jgi:hypothetical protein
MKSHALIIFIVDLSCPRINTVILKTYFAFIKPIFNLTTFIIYYHLFLYYLIVLHIVLKLIH